MEVSGFGLGLEVLELHLMDKPVEHEQWLNFNLARALSCRRDWGRSENLSRYAAREIPFGSAQGRLSPG